MECLSSLRRNVEVVASLRHSYDHETTCGICGGPCGVTHSVYSYFVDARGPRKNVKNRQVGPLKYDEDP